MERNSQAEVSPEARKARRRLIWARAVLAVGAISFVVGAAVLSIGLRGLFGGDGAGGADNQPGRTWVIEGLDSRDSASGTVELADAIVYYNLPPIYRITIEAIDVDAPVMRLWADSDGVPLTPNSADNVAWYNFSAKPGAGGNAVLAGHVTWNRAPAVFAHLDDLEDGDTIRLESKDGEEFVYEVFASFSMDPKSPDALLVMAPTPTDTITLITCGGTWIPDGSDPFDGDFSERVVVQGRLVDSTAAAPGMSALGGG